MGVDVQRVGMNNGNTKPGHEQVASSASYEARGASSLRLVQTRRRSVEEVQEFDLNNMVSHLSKRHALEVMKKKILFFPRFFFW